MVGLLSESLHLHHTRKTNFQTQPSRHDLAWQFQHASDPCLGADLPDMRETLPRRRERDGLPRLQIVAGRLRERGGRCQTDFNATLRVLRQCLLPAVRGAEKMTIRAAISSTRISQEITADSQVFIEVAG